MSSEFTLYHNPRCSKSRAAFDLLEARGIKAEVVLQFYRWMLSTRRKSLPNA